MEPNFNEGDFIIVNCWAYLPSLPKINDVIIIHQKNNLSLLKRIKKIRGNRYFVIGDNRKLSKDSRSFGAIEKNQIVGKVLFHIKKS